MRMHAFLAALAFGFGGLPAAASAGDTQAAAPTPPAARAATPRVAKPESDDERMVCKAERTIGSNRVQRVCRSAAQIEREREAARSQLDKAQVGG